MLTWDYTQQVRTVTIIFFCTQKLMVKVKISKLGKGPIDQGKKKKRTGGKKKNRSRQDSNLRGETPMDF